MFLVRTLTIIFEQVQAKDEDLIAIRVRFNFPVLPVYSPDQVKSSKQCQAAIKKIWEEIPDTARSELSQKHTALLAIRTDTESLSLETLIASWVKLTPALIF
jgi:hypothetical protein